MTQYAEFVELFVNLWHEGLHDPARTQASTLEWLLQNYARTLYGQKHDAAALLDLAADPPRFFDAYRRAFPVVTYDQIKPWIDRVIAGEVDALLPDPPVAWAMTRGTTRGTPKRIPITQADLGIRVAAARALLNHLLRTGHLDAIDGYCLNLNYPSVMGTMTVAGQETPYGFSSGIYVRHAAEATPVEILPRQEEIDALGGGTSRADWQRRFEMVYQRTKDAPVTLCAGVCPSIIEFGHYLQRRHKVRPKDLWAMRAIAATSVPGIHTKWAPALRALYGDVDIIEMYIATEGTFAQQRDDRRLLVPNFDLYFFEVVQKGGMVKMLHEMRAGEYGSLVVSTPVLPRYQIGDVIRAFDPPYLSCIGREGRWTKVRYQLDGLANLDFGRA
ncbi:MAG: GH3 auxin-responsive promoter family protein [Anaerolineae bacterium]|nr:GH3 auxin-responsive promoter family protein [Anaerolineae bacterium]